MQVEKMMERMEAGVGQREMPRGEIPELELYIDQITTLFDSRLALNKRTPEEKLITKTMINNYSKDGLLKRIKGKKYSKEHILMMLIIYNLKQTLSIQDIGRIMAGIDGEAASPAGGYDGETVARLYDSMLDAAVRARKELPDFVRAAAGEIELGSDKLDAAAMVLALTSAANLFRRAAEHIIDQTFLPPEK